MSELREALDEAWVDDEAEDNAESQPEAVGEDVPEGSEEGTAPEGEAPQEAVAEADEGAADEPASKDGPSTPVGWDEGTWAGVPEAAREHIAKREADVEKVMRNTSDARRTHQALGQLTQTYGAVMATEGVQDPIQAFDGLMQTVSQLRMGSAAQKAKKMADLIQHFGIDVGELDNALVGEAPSPEVQQSEQVQQMLDQRLAPVDQMMYNLAQLQQNQQMQKNQGIAQEVDGFAKGAEFIDHVRGDMADLMDMATARGQQMTLQEAYDKACQVNPQVQATMRQRMEQKAKAASSVAGRGQGTDAGKGNQSLHDELVAAWENFS